MRRPLVNGRKFVTRVNASIGNNGIACLINGGPNAITNASAKYFVAGRRGGGANWIEGRSNDGGEEGYASIHRFSRI